MPNLGDPAIDDEHADRRELTDEERRNVAVIERWRELYDGDDMEAFVRETYHPSFRVVIYDGADWTGNSRGVGNVVTSAEAFIAVESHIKRACPGRRIRFNRVIPAGNVVTVEASLLDDARPEWELSWVGVYTFADGLIVSDHSYLNRRDWPGIGSTT